MGIWEGGLNLLYAVITDYDVSSLLSSANWCLTWKTGELWRFSKPKVVDIWYLKAYSRASQRWDWPTPSLLSPVACSMMECCRVDDTSPERAVTGLSPGWVDPDVDWLYISINRPQPTGTRASTRSLPITGRSERRRNDPMVILFKVRTCHMPE